MKTGKKQNSTVGKNVPRHAEIRDDLDSRKQKEDAYKSKNNKEGTKPNTKSKNKAGN